MSAFSNLLSLLILFLPIQHDLLLMGNTQAIFYYDSTASYACCEKMSASFTEKLKEIPDQRSTLLNFSRFLPILADFQFICRVSVLPLLLKITRVQRLYVSCETSAGPTGVKPDQCCSWWTSDKLHGDGGLTDSLLPTAGGDAIPAEMYNSPVLPGEDVLCLSAVSVDMLSQSWWRQQPLTH